MTILQTALDYLARGLSVIPLRAPTKKAGPPWEKYQTVLPTPAEWRGWVKRFPRCNLGLVTGAISGVVIVDVDTYKGGSVEGLPATGVIARTGRGGLQYFYRHPGVEVRPAVGVRPGIDIRGDGGYVAIAPSDTTGNPDNNGEGGPYTWISEDWDALGDAPDWVVTPEENEEHEPSQDNWLTQILEGGALEGSRNDTLCRLAGYYAAKQIPRDVILAMCRQWNANLDKPLPDSEVETTVASACKAEARKNRPKQTAQQSEELLPMLGFDEYMAKHGDATTSWIIKDWLPDATIAFLISPPQSYKTYATFDLAVSVASGAPFLGHYPVLNRGPVAIFQQEDPHGNIAERFALISMARMECVEVSEDEDGTVTIPVLSTDDVPLYFHEERRLKFESSESMDALEEFIKRARPRLVIIDPLYSAAGTEEHMAKAAQQMLRLKDLRDKYGVSFVIVHHTAKAMDSWDRQHIWGSQFLNAFMETCWTMRRPGNENCVVVLRHFKVSGPQPFMRLTFDMQVEKTPWRYSVTPEEISAKEAEKVVRRESDDTPRHSERPNKAEEKILKALSGGPLSVEALADKTKTNLADVDKLLRALHHKHRVKCDPEDRWVSLDPKDDDD